MSPCQRLSERYKKYLYVSFPQSFNDTHSSQLLIRSLQRFCSSPTLPKSLFNLPSYSSDPLAMTAFKPEFTSEFNELEAPDAGHQKSAKSARIVESARLALTALALLSSISILGTSGDTLSVFNTTHLGEDFLLPLWPNDFDLRPTIALVVCSAIVVVTSALSLAVSKVPAVRSKPLIHSSMSYLAPTVCLVAALVGTSFFYGVNSSNTTSSLQSWSCQWSAVSMNVKPYWGTLCKESKAALYLTIMLIPLELLIFSTVAISPFVTKKQVFVHERKGSPAMS